MKLKNVFGQNALINSELLMVWYALSIERNQEHMYVYHNGPKFSDK